MKLQPVRGTHDYLGKDFDLYHAVIAQFEHVAKLHHYTGIATPIFESTHVFTKNLGDTSDIVTKEMYTFEDRGGDSLTLRPEGTAPVVRAVISNGLTQTLPQKLYYHGPMFRYERPQKGRMRQLHQFGVECIGPKTPQSDVEVLHLAAQALKSIGVLDKVTLEINSLGDTESRQNYRTALVTYFAQYTHDLSEESKRRLGTNPLRILDSKNEGDQKICATVPKLSGSLNALSRKHFDDVCALLQDLKIAYIWKESLVRGLDYYNHTAFEFSTTHLGAQGTVLAGGRYNGLVESMGGPAIGGVGFAAGMERLMLLSEMTCAKTKTFAVIPLDEASEHDAFILAQNLRDHGVACEYGFSGNGGKRIKQADKAGIAHALLITHENTQSGKIALKNLITGEQTILSFEGDVTTLAGRMSESV